MPIIVQIDAYDPVAAAPVTLRMASDDDVAVCHLNGQIWWPVLDKLPVLAMDFFGGEFGQVTTAAASLSLAVEPWPDFARYAFADARLRIWHGNDGAVWAGYTLRFDGRVTAQPVIADGRAQIGFAVDDKWLDTPMLATYSGSGGAEGKAAMKGTPKPLAIGAPMGVPGVMLDSVKSILQLSAYGAIESVDVPLERLARQFGSPIADYETYTELDAASVPAGQWATAKAVGLVRMGAPPYGKLCFLMKGDKGGVDGWVRRPGAIIKRFAALAGGAAKVSEVAVDALDVARPYDLSVYYDRQITARAAVQEIAASVNAVAGVSLTGQLIVVPIQINSTGLTLRADGSSLPMVGSVRALGISAPWWRLAIGAQPFFDVHGQGEYATETTPEAGATRNVNRGEWSGASVAYAVGDFVQRNGSSYSVITAHTSTADNGPPGANWALLAAQGTPGTPGTQGAPGAAGTAAITGYLTNESVQLWSYANGGVVSYTPATGNFRVFSGTTDVSASFTLSTVSNPQALTVGYSGQTYSVTGGFDANEDTASLTIRATGSGSYAGVTIDKVFSLAKAKGGYEIVSVLPTTANFNGRMVFLTTDGKLYRFTTQWTRAVNGADIEAGTVTTDALAAGSVTAAKMAVTSLSAITATIGLLRTATTGQRLEISDGLISVFYSNGVPAVRLGIWNDDA